MGRWVLSSSSMNLMPMLGRITTKTLGRCVRLDAVDCCQALPSIGTGLPRPSEAVRLSDKQDGKVGAIIVVNEFDADVRKDYDQDAGSLCPS
mmetsp:Transcript_20452/g.37549  ORF Transcript_20452/g.37549 Transcript_20452/m.37549 type:complete len:92 (-) Transcript_20452:109-384(-)